MTCTYIALLRAANVGGRNLVSMPKLCSVFADLGLEDARSLLQSGNVVFKTDARPADQLEQLLQRETRERLKVDVDFIVRTMDEWKDIVARNPFAREARADPSHLLVIFLKAAPGAESIEGLRAAVKGRESLRATGRHAYITYPDGIGRSKLTTALIEDKLGVRGTGRNWNTVLKLLALGSTSNAT